MKPFVQTILFIALRNFTWRWLFVPPVFLLAGWLYVDDIQFDLLAQFPRAVNIWDIPPAMLVDQLHVAWIFILGFIIVVGDNYIQDREMNTIALVLQRTQSRAKWWLARILALGMLAISFVALAFLFSMIGSAFQVPITLQDSPSALNTGEAGMPGPASPRWQHIPMPLFVVFVGVYTAFGLWFVASIVVTISLIYPHPYLPIGFILTWLISSFSISHLAIADQFDVMYFVSYRKLFVPRLPVSPLIYTLMTILLFFVMLYVGTRQAQKADF
ncbi:MAG: hypothetical protein GFH27_549333n103 [Chloroflexi bacterium AL-W]|nr:hypothetical protein [Chloroflexi bacterium AL-N1]NOK70444.1 hypothetical protein [Chloroflexi bacterium AL-N10]NOK78197.1 hypothetical protein [Chloroflexi bacterium AL-N5]NOK85296.1 hypothetical protein [Chloroflexi bacterium AL-W]NOK92061.1 hypothetical protein [Chloroflexi bacterium AL-N15]